MWMQKAEIILSPLMRPYCNFRLVGEEAENFPPDGPCVLAPNHASFLDPWLISFATGRIINWLTTDKWYYKSPFWQFFFKAHATLPVTADNPQQTIDDVCRYLGEGKMVGVFPEGAITYDGKIQRFRPGVARIAAQSGVPIYPVGLRGTYKFLPRHHRFPRPARVEAHLGKPLFFPGSPRSDVTRRECADFTNVLFEHVSRLAGQEDALQLLETKGKRVRATG